MRVVAVLGVSLVLCSACSSSSSSGGGVPSEDASAPVKSQDGSSHPDLSVVSPDVTTKPDLLAGPDLAPSPDLAPPAELASKPDLFLSTDATDTPVAYADTSQPDAPAADRSQPDAPAADSSQPDAPVSQDVSLGRDAVAPDRRYNLGVDVSCINPCLACVRTKCEPDYATWAIDPGCSSFASCIGSCECTQMNCGEGCGYNNPLDRQCSAYECIRNTCKTECAIGGNVMDGLQECPSDRAGLLTAPIIDLKHVAALVPLGNAAPPLHVFPVDHTYFNAYEGTDCTSSTCGLTDFYSPGNGTVTHVLKVVNHYFDGSPDEYSVAVDVALCSKIVLRLGGVESLSDFIEAAVQDAWPVCQTNPPKHPGESSIDTCEYLLNKPVAAGEVLGKTGGTEFPEIWAYDYSIVPDPNIDWKRYNYYGYAYATCYLDFYSGAVKDAHYAKLGSYLHGTFTARTVSPLCGSSRQTVVGTAQGDWFLTSAGGWDNPSGGMGAADLALEHHNIDPTLGEWVIGGAFATAGVLTFTPKHTGTTDREFSEITPGTTVYCYDNPNGGGPAHKYLLKLGDSHHLQVEQQNGTCGGSESLQSPTAYER